MYKTIENPADDYLRECGAIPGAKYPVELGNADRATIWVDATTGEVLAAGDPDVLYDDVSWGNRKVAVLGLDATVEDFRYFMALQALHPADNPHVVVDNLENCIAWPSK